jgi:hypothetical protein
MKTACPQCGAEIEFRFDDSFLRVCGNCRSAVARTDRGVETLGRVADLVPMQSPLALFAEGNYGGMGFILVGKAQLRHAAGGMWQEWYAKFSSGVWGWLAEAQGRYYMTFEVPNLPVTPHYQLAPGTLRSLPTHAGERTFTVSEVGVATYVAADGELPYRLTPGAVFRYADLSDGQGGFATIDYGPPESRDPRVAPAEPPSIYIGGQIRLQDLNLMGGEMAPPGGGAIGAGGPRITSQRLACPNCNGSLELRAPDATLRVVCPFCNTMIDVGAGGQLTLLKMLESKAKPLIPLGVKATFLEGEVQLIGYLERSAKVDGRWYAFEEYLLHAPQLGFRWLVCSDGHWSYVQPIAAGACDASDTAATYKGKTFKRYQAGPLRVDRVLGEFYWRVAAGNRSNGDDYVAAPAMISREVENGEVNWSLSSYLTQAQLREAFGSEASRFELPALEGVAPNQPWRHRGFFKYYGLLLAALILSGIAIGATTHAHAVTSFRFEVPGGRGQPPPEAPPSTEQGHVFFSEPFAVRGGENIELALSAPVSNNWLYYVVDLVDEERGAFITFDGNLEFYSGYDGGESWSEGSRNKTQILAPMPKGVYVARVEAMHGSPTEPLNLQLGVRQNVYQVGWWGLAFGAMLIPGLLMWWSARRFEKKRWENSSFGGDDDDDDDGGSRSWFDD